MSGAESQHYRCSIVPQALRVTAGFGPQDSNFTIEWANIDKAEDVLRENPSELDVSLWKVRSHVFKWINDYFCTNGKLNDAGKKLAKPVQGVLQAMDHLRTIFCLGAAEIMRKRTANVIPSNWTFIEKKKLAILREKIRSSSLFR